MTQLTHVTRSAAVTRWIAVAILLLVTLPSFGQDTGPIKIEIKAVDGKFELLRGGKPYIIKGAGVVEKDYATLAQYGGNSIRTWSMNDAQQRLDAAYANGLTMSLCLPVVSERFGMDYDDTDAVAKQLALMREYVDQFKDHPALLAWIIGNELNYAATNDKVYTAINEISKMIHEVDPNHLTTSAVTDSREEFISLFKRMAPDLDFIGLQLYGAIVNLKRDSKKALSDVPFVVTEWGPLGHWGGISNNLGRFRRAHE